MHNSKIYPSIVVIRPNVILRREILEYISQIIQMNNRQHWPKSRKECNVRDSNEEFLIPVRIMTVRSLSRKVISYRPMIMVFLRRSKSFHSSWFDFFRLFEPTDEHRRYFPLESMCSSGCNIEEMVMVIDQVCVEDVRA